MPPDAKLNARRARRLSFSMRSMLILFVVVSVPLALIVRPAQRQKATVAYLRKAGAMVFYDYQVASDESLDVDSPDLDSLDEASRDEYSEPPGPRWLRSLLGIDYVARVAYVDFRRVSEAADWGELFDRLAGAPSLRILNLQGCSAAPETYLRISPLPLLERLDLRYSNANDDSLSFLSDSKKLKHLNLEESDVRGRGLAYLEGASGLVTLDLSQCPLVDDDIRFPTRMPQLTELDLSETGLLHARMPEELPALETLDLHGTNLASDDLAPLARYHRLQKVDLAGIDLDDSAYASLGALTSIRELVLNDTPTNDARLRQLSALRHLELLSLSGTLVSDGGLAALDDLKKLRQLDLSRTRVSGPGLAHLAGLPALRHLSIANSSVDDAGVRGIEKLTSVEWLNYEDNAITIEGLAHIAAMPAGEGERYLSFVDPTLGLRFGFKWGANPDDDLKDDIARRFLHKATSLLEVAALPENQRDELLARLETFAKAIRSARVRPLPPRGRAISSANIARRLRGRSPDEILAVRVLIEADQQNLAEESPPQSFTIDWSRIDGSRRPPLDNSESWWLDSVEEWLFDLYRSALRSACGFPDRPPDPADLRRSIFSQAEVHELWKRRVHGLPYEDHLQDIAKRGVLDAANAALDVASEPRASAWMELDWHARDHRVAVAWREYDPGNAATWYGPWREEYLFAGPPPGKFLFRVESGNACPRVQFDPRPPWLDDELLAKALEILTAEGVNVAPRPKPVSWSNPWQWTSRGLDGCEELLDQLEMAEDNYLDDQKTLEAARYRQAVETAIVRLMTAPPRELATVFTGCRMLSSRLEGSHYISNMTIEDQFRSRLRQTACYRLAETLTRESFRPEGPPLVDKSTMTSWMSGLARCSDARAVRMSRAIDEWAEQDRRIVGADLDELKAIYEAQWGEAPPLNADGRPEFESLRPVESLDDLDPWQDAWYYLRLPGGFGVS